MGVALMLGGDIVVGAALGVEAVLGPWWGSDCGGFDDDGGGPEGGLEGGLEGGPYGNFSIMVVFLGTYNTIFFLYGGLT